ncbi:hypothetical protein BKA62DRAFT_718101 [Auriculariales sp. MPI-PUGE-AT-0066]|nr:hypothetical protein BKA62DRAFT_718101 [Auriculariales sp. MPI-PUGE-AT-0066]
MSGFNVFRLVANVAFILFSFIVLGLSASIVAKKEMWFGAVPSWLGFTLLSRFSRFSLGLFFAINRTSKNAITNIAAVELVWTGLLGIFWLSAAGAQTSYLYFLNMADCSAFSSFSIYGSGFSSGGLSGGFDVRRRSTKSSYGISGSTGFGDIENGLNTMESVCHQFKALQAFSWLSWLVVWGWMLVLLIRSIVAYNRGNKKAFTSQIGEPADRPTTSYPQYPNSYPPQQTKAEYDGPMGVPHV